MSKSVENTTEKDIIALKAFVKQHQNDSEAKKPLLLLNDVHERLMELNGLELTANVVGAVNGASRVAITDYDVTVAKLKSEIHKLNTKIKRVGNSHLLIGVVVWRKGQSVRIGKRESEE